MADEEKLMLCKLNLLMEFKKLAKENGIKRLDNCYLQKFLVGHQYKVFSALTAVQSFESFLDRRREKWLNIRLSKLVDILNAKIIDVLDDEGIQEQKIVWIRIENWDPQMFTADDLLEVSGLLCELVYARTKEIKHIDVIIDLHYFSLKHLYGLSPKFARRMVFFMAECLPMTILHVYVVRQPKIFSLVYALFKPFVEERMRQMITICGYNFQYLLANIGCKVLPNQLGGQCKDLNPARWLQILNAKSTQYELKTAGYNFT